MNEVRRTWEWLALVGLLLASTAVAGPYEDGVAAYDRGDFSSALKLWQALADEGHAAAQFNVGVLYEKGLGTPADLSAAGRWYLKAAEQGDPDAQYSVAVLYETGRGYPQEPDLARKWYAEVIANPRAAAESDVKKRARTRLANLATSGREAVAYDAGRFVVLTSEPHACVIALQGPITHDTSLKFDEVVAKATGLGCEQPWLLLESPGGSLDDGIALGKEVRFGKFRTMTRYDCASACSLIFLAGSERLLLGSRARIGFHQASLRRKDDRHCSSSFDDAGVREMRRYLGWVIPGMSERIMQMIMQTPCDKIEWMAGKPAIDAGVATRLESEDVDIFGAKSRRLPPAK